MRVASKLLAPLALAGVLLAGSVAPADAEPAPPPPLLTAKSNLTAQGWPAKDAKSAKCIKQAKKMSVQKKLKKYRWLCAGPHLKRFKNKKVISPA